LELNELEYYHLDGIKEAVTIGSGHAATALSQMIGKNVFIKVPEVKILKIEEFAYILGEKPPIVAATLTNFFGDITGRNLLIFPEKNARLIIDVLLNKKPGETKTFGEMEISSIKEVANIITSSYLGAISEFLKIMVLPSVPSFVLDDVGAITSSAYLEFADGREYGFCVETNFYFTKEDLKLDGFLLMIPDKNGLETMLKNMGLI